MCIRDRYNPATADRKTKVNETHTREMKEEAQDIILLHKQGSEEELPKREEPGSIRQVTSQQRQ